MIRYVVLSAAIIGACFPSIPSRADHSIVSGRVIDSSGDSVAHADLSPFWRANGSPRRSDGTDYDLSDRDEVSKFWGNIGDMQPFQPGTTSDADGAFTLDTLGKRQFIVMDKERRRGAVHRLRANSQRTDVEIQLGRLTTVKARVIIEGSVSGPIWSHVYVNLESDPDYPLDNTRVVSCGSETQAFEFSLPEGTYTLDVYAISGSQPENIDLRVIPDQQLVIGGDGGTIDLGVLVLQEDLPDREDLERGSKAAKLWRDYTKHYGEPCPNWHAVDVRGIDLHANIEDLRGKWVLLEFWGLSCAPCLSKHMPATIDFYLSHARQRDQFAVIGICIDITGKLQSIQDLDAALQPIVDKVWDGEQVPFPVVLDNTFKTWERFGIPGLGTAVLVDPQGNLVEGGMEALRRILKGRPQSDAAKSR